MAKIKDPGVDKQIHAGRRAKLRALFVQHGLETFNETQVIEFALGMTQPRVDTNPTAHRLINAFGSLVGVIEAHPDKLQEIGGIGENSAHFLHFLKQFVTYYEKSSQSNKQRLTTPTIAANYLRGVMKTYSTEQFVLICLDKTGRIILEDTITSGSLEKVDINLKNLVDTILRVKAASVLVAHNHLTSDPSPSNADIKITRRMINVLTPLSISVMDHLIFANNGTEYSFLKDRKLDILRREHHSFINSEDYEEMMVGLL